MHATSSWKHVIVVLNEHTLKLDVVLRGANCDPLGPRLEKGLSMPDHPHRGLESRAAIAAANVFDQWLKDQEDGKKDAMPVKLQHDHYGSSEPKNPVFDSPKAAVEPKPVANEPKPAVNVPKPKPRDLFDL